MPSERSRLTVFSHLVHFNNNSTLSGKLKKLIHCHFVPLMAILSVVSLLSSDFRLWCPSVASLTQTCLQSSHCNPGRFWSHAGSSERGSHFSGTLSSVGNWQLLFLSGGSKCLRCSLLFARIRACLPSSLSVGVWACERTPWHISVSRELLPGITGSTNVGPVWGQQRRQWGQVRRWGLVLSRSVNCSWNSRVLIDGILWFFMVPTVPPLFLSFFFFLLTNQKLSACNCIVFPQDGAI